MQNSDILALAGLRVDGRRCDEIRRIAHNLGCMDVADGSAYLEQGLNKVLVTIHGPQEPQRRSGDPAAEYGAIKCQLINAPFSGSEHKRRRAGDRRSNEVEQIIKQTMEAVVLLDLYPKSEIQILIHLLESDGSTICAMINAVTLALMDAGIAMSDMIVACSAGFIKQQLHQDLTQVEQSAGGAYLPVAMKARSEEIVFMQLDSRLSVDNIEEALKTAIDGGRKIRTILQTGIRDRMCEALGRVEP